MATIVQSRHADMTHTNHALTGPKLSVWTVPVARFLYSLIFILAGINHFSSGTIGYAASSGVPFANILVPISGAMAIAGGISVLLGSHARFGALLLILFLVPVTIMMHNFWAVTDPAAAQMQMVNFLKNLGLMGGALLIAFYGAGPVSWDQHHRQHHVK